MNEALRFYKAMNWNKIFLFGFYFSIATIL